MQKNGKTNFHTIVEFSHLGNKYCASLTKFQSNKTNLLLNLCDDKIVQL